jgi:peptidoglycan/LPS O-acetylase OafA/YrhL
MGLLRLFLATVVAMAHLQTTDLQARGLQFWGYYYVGFNAGYAVMAFYMISGFLISMVLASKYKREPASFYFKRGVRIFSLYLPIAAIAFLFVDGTLRDFEAANGLQKVTNFSLIGSDWLILWRDPSTGSAWLALPTPLHQAWTLSAELTFYLAAPWLLRSNAASALALIGSATIRFAIAHKLGWSDRWLYYFLPSTFLFFLIGHWARVLAQRFSILGSERVGWGLLAACFAILVIRRPYWDTVGYWSAMMCLGLSLPGLFNATKNNVVLNWLGALSYPMYLVHNMVRMIAIENWHVDRYWPHLPHVAPATALMVPYVLCVLFAAALAHQFIERPCAWFLTQAGRLFGQGARRGVAAAPGHLVHSADEEQNQAVAIAP